MRFRLKLTAWMTILLSLVYAVSGTLLIHMSFRASLEMEHEKALRSYRSLRSTLVLANTISEQNTVEDVTDILRQLAAQGGEWNALRLRKEEKVLFESGTGISFAQELSEQCSDTVCCLRTMQEDQNHYQQVTGALSIGENLLYLDAVYDITDIYTLRQTQQRIYRVMFAAVAALSALISFVAAYVLTKPLAHLSKTSQNIAKGDLTLRANVHSGDEIEILANDFNLMTENLVDKIHSLEEAMVRQERFMGSFAHELKTPMTSIIGYSDLLRSCDMTAEEQRDAAGYIFSEGKRLESLSLKLLDLLVLGKQDFTLRPENPADIISEIARLMQENAYRSPITLRYRAENGRCLLEPDLVKSLLMNLIDNAIKSMDEHGGTVSIHAKMLEDGCEIIIRDTGRGMPQEEIAHITEAFYRVDKSRSRRQGGVGLGLALCQEIVRLHHGNMEFASEEGKGTTVTITLKGGAA